MLLRHFHLKVVVRSFPMFGDVKPYDFTFQVNSKSLPREGSEEPFKQPHEGHRDDSAINTHDKDPFDLCNQQVRPTSIEGTFVYQVRVCTSSCKKAGGQRAYRPRKAVDNAHFLKYKRDRGDCGRTSHASEW